MDSEIDYRTWVDGDGDSLTIEWLDNTVTPQVELYSRRGYHADHASLTEIIDHLLAVKEKMIEEMGKL